MQPSLFSGEKDEVSEQIVWLAMEEIQAGAYQPRQHFEDEALRELQQSIAEYGILQPLIVRRLPKRFGADSVVRYEIIAGERRFRAAQLAGLTQVPCWIRAFDHHVAATVALVENVQRQDLNVMEVALGYQRLIDEFSMTHQQVADKVGCSRSAVSNVLRLLSLEAEVQSALRQGRLEMAHARALLSLNGDQQRAMLQAIEREGLSVRAVEQRVRQMSAVAQSALFKKRQAVDVDVMDLQQRLSVWLGHEVALEHHRKGYGKISIRYQDLDGLDDLLRRLGYVGE